MKNNCFLNYILISALFAFGFAPRLIAQQAGVILIDSDFKKTNIKSYSKVNDKQLKDEYSYFYFSFENEYNTISFAVKNDSDKVKNLILEFSNALIKEITLSKIENNTSIPLYKTGIDYTVSQKPLEHRLFAFPIKLEANETSTYRITLKKEVGKPLVTSAYIKSESTFNKQGSIQQVLIGLYYGISLLSVFFSLFVFYYLRKSSYLIYAAYIIFLGLFISSYTGLFSQLFLNESDLFNKYKHYVLFSEISLLLFVVFSQKILEAKVHTPKLKRTMDVLLIVLVSIRVFIHFFLTELFERFVPLFMNLWYAIFLVLVVLISIEIVVFFKTNSKRSSFFAIAYLFMITGVFLTILYHSYGLVNTTFYGLPVIFYSSFLEILFLTFTVVFMVKDIYDERNILSEKIVIEEKKNLTAFIKGEDQERNRISKELHDNIGSKLSYLKRFVSDKFKDEEINDAIDNICNDVRNLSHEISPSDLTLVGFESAISDLTNSLSGLTSLSVDFNSYHFPGNLSENVEVQLYRVVQEVLNNILKHAEAKHIDVQLIGHDSYTTITVEDDGKGFNLNAQKKGLGLKNITSRIEQIGGKLEVDSKINKGTSILITIPT
ncbi:7TM diverse intracellular signaling domain-containing protein [Winogradskyella sp. PG-2]|uniref:sensor histidine kinase n=1 Tax=Winogradskyella sp. PG-2 TaxID=754409 RepID=UPI000458877D|nr:7TM diverse intracellular signaling domain-containing protein [Winogradskyella sp. PG-2]BAO75526.1 sensory box histidine kinase [Winogradskyella sp. PG-2]